MADSKTPPTSQSSSSSSNTSTSRKAKSKRKHLSSTTAPENFTQKVTEAAGEVTQENKPALAEPISATPKKVDSNSNSLRETIKKHVALCGILKESWTEENELAVDKFMSDPSIKLLVVYRDPVTHLRVEHVMPAQEVEQISYFIRQKERVITQENFSSLVQSGSLSGNVTESLLMVLNGVHAPLVTLNTTWPKMVKNNYLRHLHRYIIKLTDSKCRLDGTMELYVPEEALQHQPEKAIKDKDLVNRLQMVMSHWMRQIREVLNAHASEEMSDSSGILDEILFWKNRNSTLANISQQLQKPGVCHIQAILQRSKSTYIPQFCELASQIQELSSQAKSIFSFLSQLKEPCEELAQLKPSEVAPKLAHILNLIRVIWVHCSYYNNNYRVILLFQKLNNEIISLCNKAISLDRSFQDYGVPSKQILNDCIQCCQAWKERYLRTSQIHRKHLSADWSLDQKLVFAPVEAFVKSCKDLIKTIS